ncbi:MAG: helix-turn-helix domain-containing protein [Herpetosiphonaceae bacterium]|nr:helix-turn-helix domain-containing protein [Herpetosiphonaceae bacterium]
MEETSETLGNILRYMLMIHKDDLSHEQIAEKIGISKNTLSNWINDRSKPKHKEDLVKLTEILNTSDIETDYLLHRAGFKPINGTSLEMIDAHRLFGKKDAAPLTVPYSPSVPDSQQILRRISHRASFMSKHVRRMIIIVVILLIGGTIFILMAGQSPSIVGENGGITPVSATPTHSEATAGSALPHPEILDQQSDCSELIEETIPDNSVLLSQKAYTKTWTLHNCGKSVWNNTDFHLIFSSQQPQSVWQPPQHLVVPDILPGQTGIVEMAFTTPITPTTYTVVYEFHGPRGEVKPAKGTYLRPFIIFVIK